MKMFSLAVLGALVLGVKAQSSDESSISGSPTPTETPSSTSEVSSSASGITTHTVAVGERGHSFTDDEIFAEPGDIVEFHFYPKNHSVIRADYNHPCIPYEMVGRGRTGFYSGFFPVQVIPEEPDTWQLQINDTEPLFYYCGADGSCYVNHMMGVINPNSSMTLESHMEKAEGLDFQVLPGESLPDESGHPEQTTPTADAGSGENDDDDDSDDGGGGGGGGLNGGQIAGISIGGTAVVIIGAALLFICGRRRGMDSANQQRNTWTGAPPTVSEASYIMGAKSPDSRFSKWSGAVPWGAKPPAAEPYRDPMGGAMSPTPGFPPTQVEVQPTRQSNGAGYIDPRLSSYTGQLGSPSLPLGADASTTSPTGALVQSAQVPVELPSGNGEATDGTRYSWVPGSSPESNLQASR